ncbi:NUDIX family hydrolase-like protein [Aulographum hederae CBS 113979]|uniref:NUDIX family hydrolase-like protein n=1 Tax=Aulographum hederae CBS 113979 TaxID=1176131 RepID=A0A6G1GK52_9PEZI|nr:NUDIX family hydrolase-like protein [Aulographum hederae CBS 113979]
MTDGDSNTDLCHFNLPNSIPPVPVSLPDNLTQEQLLGFKAFKTWLQTLQTSLALQKTNKTHPFRDDPFVLRSINVQAVDWFGKRIGFVKFVAEISNDHGDKLPGAVFLRGGSVAMLMILRPKDSRDERWVVLTEQPRVPAGSLSFMEIPAGMLENNTFVGGAAKEIEEETGLVVPQDELIDMTALALQDSKAPDQRQLQRAMYTSPGGSDEYIPIFLWEQEFDRQEIEDLKNRLTGVRAEGEQITIRLCDYEDLWREGARDAKTLAAWALYEGLKRSGKI